MASKKGIAVTIIILAVITGVSFLVWLIPQGNQMSIEISDYENYLDGVKEIHSLLAETISTEFQNLRDGKITPQEYLQISDNVSSQVTSKISEFVTSKPPQEWQESYISYMESLKTFNSYITETKVYANLLNDGKPEQLEQTLTKIQNLQSEYERLIEVSNNLRPQ